MEFRVLGPVEVVASPGGQPVALGGSRERAVLARLLVSANRVVAQDILIEDLWPGDQPQGAAHALWVYVSRLRKALRGAGAGDVLLTRPPGYTVAIAPETIDAVLFENGVRAAQRAAFAGRHAEAAALLADALALWRGPAYSGLTDLPFAGAEAARLSELRLDALEARIEADLASGVDSQLIAELAALTRQYPLRERLWALRMTALYQAGRQAEALRVYQELRRFLGNELGVDPTEEVRALEGAILRQELSLPAPTALPLPTPLQPRGSVFVRPEADMARLEAAWEAAQTGRRQLVLLAGEPGIGKTRRSAEIAGVVHEAGAAALFGRCEEGMGIPYQPFVEALGTYLRQAAAPALGRLAGELVRLVPELSMRFPDLPEPLAADPDTERYRLFDAVAAWLAALAAQTPTLLVLEDFHWATAPTLAMLAHLVRSGEPGRLLVIVNYRDSPIDVTPEVADAIAELLRQPDVDRLRLRGLDRAGVASYMEAQAHHELDAEGHELAGVLHAETAGNPFFVGQILRHLSETGALTRRDGRWSAARTTAEMDVPDSVRDVIAQRLARLPGATREILEFAAVQGDRVDLRVLVEAAGKPQISLLRALDPAVTARLLTEAEGALPAHRFVHALVRHTLYDALSAPRRMELHRAVGEAVAAVAGEAWPEQAADLARHWLAATPHAGATREEARRTVDYAEEAARRATASLAYEEAATHLVRALPLADVVGDPRRRVAMLVALGEAQYHAGDVSHRDTLKQAGHLAVRLGDADLAARAVLANQRFSALGAVDPERVAFIEEVLPVLGADDAGARARVLVALASELHNSDDPRRHDLARDAVAAARRLGDPVCLAHVLATAGFALWEPGTLAERLEMATELNRLAAELGEPVLEINAGLALYTTAAQQGELDQARAALATATRIADELGQPALRMRVVLAQAGCAVLDGRFTDVERYGGEGLRISEALGNRDVAGIYHSQMGMANMLQRRPDDAVKHLVVAADRVPRHVSVKGGLAWAYAEAGRPGEARSIIAGLGGASLSGVPRRVYLAVTNLTMLAAACTALDDQDVARPLYDELLPYRDQMAALEGLAIGPVAYFLGRLAAVLRCPGDANEHFAFAAEFQERTGAHGLLARTRLEWANPLAQR